VGNPSDLTTVQEALAAAGWLCMSRNETRISMNKGYTQRGFAEKVFHAHIRLSCILGITYWTIRILQRNMKH